MVVDLTIKQKICLILYKNACAVSNLNKISEKIIFLIFEIEALKNTCDFCKTTYRQTRFLAHLDTRHRQAIQEY